MSVFKKMIHTVQEDIIGTGNRTIAIVWLVCLGALVGVGIYLGSETRSFLGVADSREQQISFAYPVQIKNIQVISGQSVRQGDLMAELDETSLSESLRTVQALRDKLKSERSVRTHLNLIVSNNSVNEGDAGRGADPLSVEIDDLEKQIARLEEEKKNLYVFAPVDGIIGAINFRKGERVAAFVPILTVSPESPTYVEGFIHESLHTKFEIGKTVQVRPLSSDTKTIEGKVASVGSRIILIPPRLMAYPNMQVYGREILVEIPKHNGLLLGEKVQIKPKFEFITLSKANASNAFKTRLPVEPGIMKFSTALSKKFRFEPSGAIYLSDLKKFLVISDDTDDEKNAVLFLANADGSVDEQTIAVPGLDEVSDLESVSAHGDHVYLMGSQGLSKKGKEKSARNLFVRFKRAGLTATDAESVLLRPLMLEAIAKSKDKTLKEIFEKKGASLFEIESHFFIGDDLYVGLKVPLTKDGKAIVLKIKDYETLFAQKALDQKNLSLWKTLNFKGVDGLPHQLSDLARVDEVIYASTVCATEACGAVWKLSEDGTELKAHVLKFYKDAKPEGLAFDRSEKSFFVTFDQKDEPAKFSFLAVTGTSTVEKIPKTTQVK